MKRVFPKSSDVIHLWAQKTQTDARCSNVFFETDWNSDSEYGERIYSYGKHYELARFIDENTVMINDTGYSVTTSKHISEVRGETRQYKQFFKSETSLELVLSQVEENLKGLTNARKPELYINPIYNLWAKLNEYLYYTRTKSKTAKTKEYRKLKSIVNILDNDYKEFQEILKKRQEKERLEKEKKEKKALAESLEKFNNYETNWFRHGKYDYLRISQDGEKVETSQNISVDKSDALLLYKMIVAGKDVVGHKIAGFTINAINGTLKIGCHDIKMESVHEVGQKLSA